MLWTDRRLIITQADLAMIDSDVATIVEVEKIPVTRILDQAIQEAATVVQSMMQSAGPVVYPGGLTAGHLMAVFTTSSAGSLQGVNAPRVALTQIVVTDVVPTRWSPLKLWLAYRCLAAVMRDVCERKDVDRYKVKWDRIEEHLALTAEPLLRNNGMPVVGYPLCAPAAEQEPDTGTFEASDVTAASSPGSVGGVYDVAITWTAECYRGQRDRSNGESYLSPIHTINVPTDSAIAISIANLIPPDGTQHPAYQGVGAILQPAAANGWNVWVARRGQRLYLQTPDPLPLGTTSYALPGDPVLGGFAEHQGQYAEGNVTIFRAAFRG